MHKVAIFRGEWDANNFLKTLEPEQIVRIEHQLAWMRKEYACDSELVTTIMIHYREIE